MTTASALQLDELAQRCADETDRFARQKESDNQFCFELLRRALADGVQEAFAHVYRIYEGRVLGWVHAHSGFPLTGEDAEYFARGALSSFYFALRGPRFARFPSLPQTLAYLKLCVHTAIAQYLRDQQPAAAPIEETGDIGATTDLGERAEAEEVWAHICALLPDEEDRLLARCCFVLDLRPRQIVEQYPRRWATEREVSVALYRIRRLLRGDAELRSRVGLEG